MRAWKRPPGGCARAPPATVRLGAIPGSTASTTSRAAGSTAGGAGDWQRALRRPGVLGGGLLGLYGLARGLARRPPGLALGLAGAVLAAVGAGGQALGRLLSGSGLDAGLGNHRGGAPDKAVDIEDPVRIEHSVHIDAEPDDVYDACNDYGNFPRFLAHVVAVRDLGRRRSRWVARGPDGGRFAWNAVLTEQDRPKRLAWRSEPGADVAQSGSLRFAPHRGGTRVTLRMACTPPAGTPGHGLAALLGADPKAAMEENLARMKAFVERGAAPASRRPPAARPVRSGSRLLH